MKQKQLFIILGAAIQALILTVIMVAVLVPGQRVFAQDLSVNAIIERLEKNRVFSGVESEGTIIVKDKYGTRTTDYISHSKGSEYTLIEFTSAAEKGQKTLRVEDKIYLYYPDAEQVVTLSKSMLQQSMLNSDLSFEDLSGDQSLLESFTAELESEEKKFDTDSYKIYLSAINDRSEVYPYQRIWVDKETFSLVYAELYTRRKKLRKTLRVLETIQLDDGVYISSKIVFKDVLKKASEGTTIEQKNIELKALEDNIFSVENLRF